MVVVVGLEVRLHRVGERCAWCLVSQWIRFYSFQPRTCTSSYIRQKHDSNLHFRNSIYQFPLSGLICHFVVGLPALSQHLTAADHSSPKNTMYEDVRTTIGKLQKIQKPPYPARTNLFKHLLYLGKNSVYKECGHSPV